MANVPQFSQGLPTGSPAGSPAGSPPGYSSGSSRGAIGGGQAEPPHWGKSERESPGSGHESEPVPAATVRELILTPIFAIVVYAVVVKLIRLVSFPSDTHASTLLPGLGIGCAIIIVQRTRTLQIMAAVGVFLAAMYMSLGPGGVKSDAVPVVGFVLGKVIRAARPPEWLTSGAVWIALIDSISPIVAGFLYCKLVKIDRFRGTLLNIILLLIPVLFCVSLLSTISQMLVQYGLHGVESDGIAWRAWAIVGLAQIAGGVLFVPPVLGIADELKKRRSGAGKAEWSEFPLELAGLVAVAAATSIGIFVVMPPSGVYFVALMLIPIAVLIGAAVRTNWAGVGIVGLAIATVAAWSQSTDSGVWHAVGGSAAEQALTLQMYLLFAISMALVLAGSTNDRATKSSLSMVEHLHQERKIEEMQLADRLICVKEPIETGQAREEFKAAVQPARKWNPSEKPE